MPEAVTVVRDAGLPGLATALDTGAVLRLLRRELREHGEDLDLISLKIVELWYKPRSECKLLYQAEFRTDTVGSRPCQLLAADLLRANELPAPPPTELLSRFMAHQGSVTRTPVRFLPEAGMVVFAFPLDTALPPLIEALDPARMQQHLNGIGVGTDGPVRGVKVHVLSYTPHERATFGYDLLEKTGGAGPLRERRIIAKMHPPDRPARVFANALTLSSALGRHAGFAPPIGYLAPLGVTLLEHVPGQDLGSLAGSPTFQSLVREAARAIATVHGSALPLTPRDPQRRARGVVHWAGVLIAICPELEPRVGRLRDRLAAEVEARTQVVGPMHGDCHPTNVIWDGEQARLIDFELLAYGDPLIDVGRFLASLPVSALRVTGRVNGLAAAGEAFLDEYLTATGADASRIRLFEAASLLIAAVTPFLLQRPGWEEAAALLLTESERAFRAALRGTVSVAGDTTRQLALPLSERARWITKESYMQSMLGPYLEEHYGARVTTCRVVDTRATERYYSVRYELSGQSDGRPWAAYLDGYCWGDRRRRNLFDRLTALRLALGANPEAPLLPRPVAYFPMLLMHVVETPGSGTNFLAIADTPAAVEAADKVGRAFAAVHRAPLGPTPSRSAAEELQAERGLIEGLMAKRPALHGLAVSLLTAIERHCRADEPMMAPSVQTLRSDHVLLVGERVAFTEVREITFSHRLRDLGDFLAQLALVGVERGRRSEVAQVAERLRQSYIAATGVSQRVLLAFEAQAVLRLAWTHFQSEGAAAVVEDLLNHAATTLALDSAKSAPGDGQSRKRQA